VTLHFTDEICLDAAIDAAIGNGRLGVEPVSVGGRDEG